MIVNFKIVFDASGKAVIKLPEGKTQQMDAAKIAELTEKLAKAIGKIQERHIGRYEGGVHIHEDGQIHTGH